MRIAGGVIALIAGIFGVIAALVTLSVGGLGAAFNASGATTVVGLGWGGLIFSFATIVLGAVILGVKSHTPGLLLIMVAITGAILGGTFVAICMALAAVGGFLALFAPLPATATPGNIGAWRGNTKAQIAVFIMLIICGGSIALFMSQDSSQSASPTGEDVVSTLPGGQTASTQASDEIAQLEQAQPADIDPAAVGKIFAFGSDNTDLQRDNAFAQLKGKVVQWTLEVYDVEKDDSNYKIQTQSNVSLSGEDASNVGTFVHITPRNESDRQLIEALKTGDEITVKGVISDETMRNLDLEPAILVTPVADAATTSAASTQAPPVTAATLATQDMTPSPGDDQQPSADSQPEDSVAGEQQTPSASISQLQKSGVNVTQTQSDSSDAAKELAAASAEREQAEQDKADAEAALRQARAQTAENAEQHSQTEQLSLGQQEVQPGTVMQASELAQPQSTPDQEYYRRTNSECARGFFGKACRHNVRAQVCAGVPPGSPNASVCQRQ